MEDFLFIYSTSLSNICIVLKINTEFDVMAVSIFLRYKILPFVFTQFWNDNQNSSDTVYPVAFFSLVAVRFHTCCLVSCFCPHSQRATSDELERIKKHYDSSKEDEVKLLDKPEQ